MNDSDPTQHPKTTRSDHRIVLGRQVESVSGDKATALTTSLQQVLCLAETVTQAEVRFEAVALNCQTEHSVDRTSVGRIEPSMDALNMYHSVLTAKGRWFHFHYKLKMLSGAGDYDKLRQELVALVRSTSTLRPPAPGMLGGVLSSAFVAAENGGVLPPPPPAPKRFGTPLQKPAKAPAGKAKHPTLPTKLPEAKAPDAKLPPKKKSALPKKSVAGPMPLDLGGADELTLFALSCREAGLLPGAWLSTSDLADAIKLAVVGNCSVDGEVPDEWVRVCRNRLSGADFLRDHVAEGETYWQLVLDGETETEFSPPAASPAPAPPEMAKAPPGVTPEPEPASAASDDPAEPEAPAAERLLAQLETLNGVVTRLTSELASAVEQQGEILAALRAQQPTS